MARQKRYGLAALTVAAGAVVLGFTATGPPAVQRAYQADDVRQRDLMLIAEAIYRQKSAPEDLEHLGAGVRIKDPETKKDYGYRVIAEGKYELCATFATNNLEQREQSFWVHPAGHHCYQFDVSRRTWANPGLR
jgi:hypothetical protein